MVRSVNLMMSVPSRPVRPPLTLSEVLNSKNIKRIQITPGKSLSSIEIDDGSVTSANIVPSDYVLKTLTDHGAQVVIMDPPPPSFNIFNLVFPALLLGYLFTMVRQSGSRGGMNPFAQTQLSLDISQSIDITFDDVAGIDEVKNELVEIVDFLKNPSKYARAGAVVPKGCLLSGDPGTGKTLLAKAIAGEANVPFINISASQFVEMFVGLGASRIRQLFKKAKDNSPCIIFIDEIDAIGKSRSVSVSGAGNDEREQTLNQLLTEMDGFDESQGVIVLAATNRPETLDQALLRPGRFDRKIQVSRPTLEGREMILKVHAKNKKFDEDVDIEWIAQNTMGATGAELANILNEAAIIATRFGRETIKTFDIEEAIDKVTLGLKRGNVLSHTHRKIVAYHEAGHALMSIVLNGPESVRKVTIVPRGTTGGVTVFQGSQDQENNLISREEFKKQIMIGLGGTVAEEIVFGDVTTGASGDIAQITKMAQQMVGRFGFSDTVGKVYIDDMTSIEDEVRKVIKNAYSGTLQILLDRRSLLDEIANRLMVEETIFSPIEIK